MAYLNRETSLPLVGEKVVDVKVHWQENMPGPDCIFGSATITFEGGSRVALHLSKEELDETD